MPTPIPADVIKKVKPLTRKTSIYAEFEAGFLIPDESIEIIDPAADESIADFLQEAPYQGVKRITAALTVAIITLSLAYLLLPTKEDIYRPIEPNTESTQSR